jgi:hypothetical protein
VAPGAGALIATAGGVLSIFSVTEAVAVFPAPSVAIREMTSLAPSVETTTGWGQVTVPTPPASHSPLTMTCKSVAVTFP